MIDAVTAAKWDENRAKAVVANARAIIDGRTANEIILIAADERKKALESTIATYREQVEKQNHRLEAFRPILKPGRNDRTTNKSC